MNYETHKAETLATCLRLSKLDPAYAMQAAEWYEQNAPWLLANLQAKVRQEIRRAGMTAPAVSSTSTNTTPGPSLP
jgi:hypothetical protein